MKSKNQHQVSILMPVKNAAKYLSATLDSIIQQSHTNWELLAVDDGSDDHSFQLLKDYSLQDTRIKVQRNKGKGIIDALRLAFKQSAGNYVTRMDADDLMTIDKIESLVSLLIEHGPNHLAVGQVKYFADYPVGAGYKAYAEWLNKLSSRGANFEDIYKECVIPSPCWMLHIDDLNRVKAFDSDNYPEDYDLCFRMLQAGLSVIPSDKILHLWRDHGERASRNDPNYLDNRFLALKCHYFSILHHDQSKNLVLWGAGKKGKWVAQWLQSHGISFKWICNNPNKIGHEIYGKKLEDSKSQEISTDYQFIITVAEKKANKEINTLLFQNGLAKLKHIFAFC